MAALERPRIFGRCKCGEILLKYIGEKEPYWTKEEAITRKLKMDVEIKDEKCPNCGGNHNTKIGSFYHERHYKENGISGTLCL